MNYTYKSFSQQLASIFFMLISIILFIWGIINLSIDYELYCVEFFFFSLGMCLFASWNSYWNDEKIRLFRNRIFVRVGYAIVFIAGIFLLVELGNYLYIYRIHFRINDNSRTMLYLGAMMWFITLRAKKGRLFLFF